MNEKEEINEKERKRKSTVLNDGIRKKKDNDENNISQTRTEFKIFLRCCFFLRNIKIKNTEIQAYN